MAQSNCSRIVKYLLLLINFLFWIVGFTALGLFVWVITDPAMVIRMAQERNHFYIGLYVFLVVGLLTLIVAVLGCCGSLKESRCMLIGFFCCLLVVIVAQVSAGAWAYHHRDKLDLMIRSSVKNTVQNEYSVIESATNVFDTFQEQLECCGANSPNDWMTSKYNAAKAHPTSANLELTTVASTTIEPSDAGVDLDDDTLTDIDDRTVNLEISSPAAFYSLPRSCCRRDIDVDRCDQIRVIGLAAPIDGQTMHLHGCTEKLIGALQDNLSTWFAVALCVIIVELFGLLFALILSCSIGSRNYK